MSRIGRAPITVPAGVEVKVDGQHVAVKGPKGALEMNVAPTMKVEVEAGGVFRRCRRSCRVLLHGALCAVLLYQVS